MLRQTFTQINRFYTGMPVVPVTNSMSVEDPSPPIIHKMCIYAGFYPSLSVFCFVSKKSSTNRLPLCFLPSFPDKEKRPRVCLEKQSMI